MVAIIDRIFWDLGIFTLVIATYLRIIWGPTTTTRERKKTELAATAADDDQVATVKTFRVIERN